MAEQKEEYQPIHAYPLERTRLSPYQPMKEEEKSHKITEFFPSISQPVYSESQELLGEEPFHFKPEDNPYIIYQNTLDKMRTKQGRNIVTETILKKYPNLNANQSQIQELVNRAILEDKITNISYVRPDGRKRMPSELLSQVKNAIQIAPEKFYEIDKATGEPILTGFGLNSKSIPKRFSLGKIIIDLQKLYYQNTLSIRDKNNYVIAGMNVVRVSDEFVKLIFKLIRDKSVTKADVKSLSISERQLYDNVMFLSGLHKENYTSSKKTIEHWKEQEKILRGEVEAGNNNPEIYSKYKQVLHKLQHFGVISSSNVKNSLKELRLNLGVV
jgi:hypothetical protein